MPRVLDTLTILYGDALPLVRLHSRQPLVPRELLVFYRGTPLLDESSRPARSPTSPLLAKHRHPRRIRGRSSRTPTASRTSPAYLKEVRWGSDQPGERSLDG